jgi:hypothetical protein
MLTALEGQPCAGKLTSLERGDKLPFPKYLRNGVERGFMNWIVTGELTAFVLIVAITIVRTIIADIREMW